jgi:hypothetical protein
MSQEHISEEQVALARHMTQALLGSMTPYQIAKEIGLMYHTVIKIANAETSWISTQTFEILTALYHLWRLGEYAPGKVTVEPMAETAGTERNGRRSSKLCARILNIRGIEAEMTRLEKRLVILQRMGDLADQLE